MGFSQAIGSVCIRHYDFMLGESLKSIYLNVSILITMMTTLVFIKI